MRLAKDVAMYMISIFLLGMLAAIDYAKKEIHICILLPASIIWIAEAACYGKAGTGAAIAAALLIGFSIVTRQALGMADAIVLSLIALSEGVAAMLIIFFVSNIMFIIFAFAKFRFRQRKREYPFIPFIFFAFIAIKFILKENI